MNVTKTFVSIQRVFLEPYDPCWAEEFARESSLVTIAMGNLLVAIHHIGSTAIPGMHAKPVIDMLAAVRNVFLLDERNTRLEGLGYEAMGEFGIPERRYFRKDGRDGNRTRQIHAFQVGSPQIARHLAFRDFMRVHHDYANQYSTRLGWLGILPTSRATRTAKTTLSSRWTQGPQCG